MTRDLTEGALQYLNNTYITTQEDNYPTTMEAALEFVTHFFKIIYCLVEAFDRGCNQDYDMYA